MTGFLTCPVCQELHQYRKDVVIAFFCPFLNGVIHFEFFTKERIEEHKKEAEPKGLRNLFRKRGEP